MTTKRHNMIMERCKMTTNSSHVAPLCRQVGGPFSCLYKSRLPQNPYIHKCLYISLGKRGIIISEKYFKALKQYTSTTQKSAHHQTFNHWHSNCLLSKITRGEQVDLSSNNKHISDAWQVMASSGNKKPLQFTVSNVDSCRRKSLLLTDVPVSFTIKVLSRKSYQFSSWRLI